MLNASSWRQAGTPRTRELRSAQRRTRRLRALLAVVAAALVAAVIAGSFALAQRASARHTATVAQAGRLAAQSREISPQHPDLGLLLALEAGRLDDSVDSRGALLGALEHGSESARGSRASTHPSSRTAFGPDGKLLATTTIEGTTLWDTQTWKPVGPPLRSSQGGWEGVDFSPDGRTSAIAGKAGRIELWDVATRRELRELTYPAATADEPALSAVRYSPDGSVIAAGPQETNHVTLWDAATGRVIGRPITTNPPGTGGAQSISSSPDSKWIVVPGAPGTVGIWDIATGHRVGRPLVVGNDDVEAAILTDAGRVVIAADDSGAVSMLDVRTGKPVGPPLSVGDDFAIALDVSPDGRLVAAASYKGTVFVWDTKTGEPYGSPLTADTSPVNDITFSPDGWTLVTSHLRSAVVWNMSGEQAIGAPLGGPADLTTDVSFSPDGERLAAGRFDGSAIVYDTATRRQVLRIDAGSVVTAVAFDPDGKSIAVGTIDGQVRSSIRRAGRRALGSRWVRRRSGRWHSARTVGCSRWPWTRTARTGSTASRSRARCSSGTWIRGVASDGRCRPTADRCSPSPSAGTARCWRPAATAGGSISGTWPLGHPVARR